MSEEVTPTQTGATDSPTETGRSTEQPAVPSDSGNNSDSQPNQSTIDKAVGEALSRANKKYSAIEAELAALKAEREAEELEGMKPEEILAKNKELSGELQALRDFKQGIVERQANDLRTEAAKLPDAKAQKILARIDSGDLETASDMLSLAAESIVAAKPSDPASPPNNPNANVGVSEEVLKDYKAKVGMGDIAGFTAIEEKYGLNQLRKAEQSYKK